MSRSEKAKSSLLITANSTSANKRNRIDEIDRLALHQRITDIPTGESAEGHSTENATLEDSERTTKSIGSSLATRVEIGR
ncbi:hypothetical protein PSHT_15910 [Puccinia striiformis]|uniref:Uncharacterized protein n=1 Tax=Puccinia striiformis TaxID=27350 RepID=A0A2S4UCE7_9BASI|nr:hypothetical protein Pst134EB_029506 [Puccinia striiformis f. sp. tritici]POV94968.1 hypothetical protein PSHT_15910 [Puccinia striiformis]